jgi:hypothetical protein
MCINGFESIYSSGKTKVLPSAETVEDMRKYAGLLSLVYGTMKFEDTKSQPAFLQGLPAIVGLIRQ